MTLQQLDFYFPFVVLTYGFVMTWLLNSDWALQLARTKLPTPLQQQVFGHRTLGFVCLIVGTLWSVQNLLLS